ncbi:hypothetical protein F01_310282 [Burkholderia cenocepacia]|nr:hypothetical protein F01_310282 [Burkholderia cenocepacia]
MSGVSGGCSRCVEPRRLSCANRVVSDAFANDLVEALAGAAADCTNASSTLPRYMALACTVVRPEITHVVTLSVPKVAAWSPSKRNAFARSGKPSARPSPAR